MHRLFVGLRPPRAMREQLLGLMAGIPAARWQTDEQLHLTLRFIGDVPRHQAEDVAAALGGVHAPVLELAPAGVGWFADSRGRANTLWAGVAPHDAVNRLHLKVDQALLRAGVEPDRRAFLPHITLARMSVAPESIERFLADHAGLSGPAARFEHMVLYESTLGGEGSVYETVARYPLAG